MKQYNLKATQREMSFGKLNVIVLGERGRGRYENLIPFQGDVTEKDFVIPVPTKSGKIKIIRGGDSHGWIARISCEGRYTRGTEGHAYVHKVDEEKVKILAYGNGAEGAAGRVGYWGDYLLEVKDDTLLRVKRHGGDKTPAYYLYFSKDIVHKISAEEISIFCDNHGYDFNAENDLEYFISIKK